LTSLVNMVIIRIVTDLIIFQIIIRGAVKCLLKNY